MRTRMIRRAAIVALLVAGAVGSPEFVSAQEGHDEEAVTEEHTGTDEYQEHGAHAAHEKNEIAVFFGGTRRLKFEDDETGATFGLEYARQFRPRVAASIGVEWAGGEIERDWVAMLKLGIQPFENWAQPFFFYVGTGIEVASIDEVLLEEDEHEGDEVVPSETPNGHADEHAAEGEHEETEVEALMRLGVGWPFHVGSFSIIPNINADIVGEDWALVGGVTLGYRF